MGLLDLTVCLSLLVGSPDSVGPDFSCGLRIGSGGLGGSTSGGTGGTQVLGEDGIGLGLGGFGGGGTGGGWRSRGFSLYVNGLLGPFLQGLFVRNIIVIYQ